MTSKLFLLNPFSYNAFVNNNTVKIMSQFEKVDYGQLRIV